MLSVSFDLSIPENEIEINAIRAQGSGGQNVNKVSSAIHLRFDIRASSLPEECKERLLNLKDRRITKEGMIVIKAQQYRTREQNRLDAIDRLEALVQQSMVVKKTRKIKKVSKSYHKKRLDNKSRKGETKSLRRKVF